MRQLEEASSRAENNADEALGKACPGQAWEADSSLDVKSSYPDESLPPPAVVFGNKRRTYSVYDGLDFAPPWVG